MGEQLYTLYTTFDKTLNSVYSQLLVENLHEWGYKNHKC
jgi:hypothetical protein